jgi:hypothetical protein
MNGSHNSPLPERCGEEYRHYVGTVVGDIAKTHQHDARRSVGLHISKTETAESETPGAAITF